MCLCYSSGQEQYQSEWRLKEYSETSNKCGFAGQKWEPLTSRTLEQETIIATLKNVYFVYVPCGEYADSGCSQSAEFHIRSWTGHQMELQPSPICLCASASSPTAGAGREGLGCVFGWISCTSSYLKKKKKKLSCFPPTLPQSLRMCWSCEIPVVVNRQWHLRAPFGEKGARI